MDWPLFSSYAMKNYQSLLVSIIYFKHSSIKYIYIYIYLYRKWEKNYRIEREKKKKIRRKLKIDLVRPTMTTKNAVTPSAIAGLG